MVKVRHRALFIARELFAEIFRGTFCVKADEPATVRAPKEFKLPADAQIVGVFQSKVKNAIGLILESQEFDEVDPGEDDLPEHTDDVVIEIFRGTDWRTMPLRGAERCADCGEWVILVRTPKVNRLKVNHNTGRRHARTCEGGS